MPQQARTARDRLYFETIRNHGELSNTELRKYASESSIFKDISSDAIEKDVDRFVKYALRVGLLAVIDGKLQFPSTPRTQSKGSPYPTSGFLTSRNGLVCRYCAKTVDLAKVKMTRNINKEYLRRLIMPRDWDPFRVICPHCKKKSTYDYYKDVKPILPEAPL